MWAALTSPEVLGALASLLTVVVGFLFRTQRKTKTELDQAKDVLDRADISIKLALGHVRDRNLYAIENILDRQRRDIRALRVLLSKKNSTEIQRHAEPD